MPLLFSNEYYMNGNETARQNATGRDSLNDYSQSFLQNTSLNHPLRYKAPTERAPDGPAESVGEDYQDDVDNYYHMPTQRRDAPPITQRNYHQQHANGTCVTNRTTGPGGANYNPNPMRLTKPTTFTFSNKIIPKSYQRRALNAKQMLEPLNKLSNSTANESPKKTPVAAGRSKDKLNDENSNRTLKLVKTKEGIISKYE